MFRYLADGAARAGEGQMFNQSASLFGFNIPLAHWRPASAHTARISENTGTTPPVDTDSE